MYIVLNYFFVTSDDMARSERDKNFRLLPGGFEIERLKKEHILQIDDVHNNLLKDKFKIIPHEDTNAEYDELEAKHSLETEPITIKQYIERFKHINLIQLVQEEINYVRHKDGPHSISLVEVQNVGSGHNKRQLFLYEVTLNQEFVDHFREKKPGGVAIDSFYKNREWKALSFVLDKDTADLKFTLDFNLRVDFQYYIRFKPIRFLFNAKNYVLQNAELIEEKLTFLVFPKPDFIDDQKLSKMKYINRRDEYIQSIHEDFDAIELNDEQRAALFAICKGLEFRVEDSFGNILPHVIRGPPGTGKSKVIINAIIRLVQDSDPRILLILPTNDSADELAYLLMESNQIPWSDLFRLNSLSSDPNDVVYEDVWKISCIVEEEEKTDSGTKRFKQTKKSYGIPPNEDLLKKKVIISTIGASTYLVLGGMAGFFTHIIADEAGQASELDLIVPIVGLTGRNTKIILSGDSAQLGPVENVNYFRKNGTTISMLERFEKIPLYKEDPRLMTFLCKNYRSHKAIVEISSQLFYDNKLVVAENADAYDSLCKWNLLPNEIRKIGEALNEWNLKCNCSTIERAQGGDCRIIIVSTVRSNANEKIGFLNSAKRFNTLISRARELFLVVGNSKIMMRENSWAHLIKSCCDNRSIIGISVEDLLRDQPSNDETADIEQNVGTMTFDRNKNEANINSRMEGNVEQVQFLNTAMEGNYEHVETGYDEENNEKEVLY